MSEHRFPVRVYYEDTDLAGIVYYANYLKFLERGRSELLRSLGVDQRALWQGAGTAFAVRRVEIDYKAPARFDDALEVVTAVRGLKGARAALEQRVERAGQTLVFAVVEIVQLNPNGRPCRLDGQLRHALAAMLR